MLFSLCATEISNAHRVYDKLNIFYARQKFYPVL